VLEVKESLFISSLFSRRKKNYYVYTSRIQGEELREGGTRGTKKTRRSYRRVYSRFHGHKIFYTCVRRDKPRFQTSLIERGHPPPSLLYPPHQLKNQTRDPVVGYSMDMGSHTVTFSQPKP